MLEGNIRDAELRRELGVPPAVDLLGHARELARVALPAVVAAAVVALAVFFVRDSGPGVYESTVVVEIRSTDAVSGSDASLGQLIAPYVALSEDSRVVAAIAAEVGEDPAALSENVSVDYGTSPTLLTVTARDGSQEEADRLAQVVVAALDQAQSTRNRTALESRIADLDGIVAGLRAELAAGTDDTTDGSPDPLLQAELDSRLEQIRAVRAGAGAEHLQVLASPASSGTKVSPKPVAEAAVAFLFTLIVVAELLVALNGRFGRTVTPAWARRTSRRYRTALQVDTSGIPRLPLDTVVMLQQRASLGEAILVLNGSGVEADPDIFGDDAAERIIRCGMTEQWWKQLRQEKVGLALIVVTTGSEDRAVVENSLRALAEIDVPTRLVVLSVDKPPAPEKDKPVATPTTPEPSSVAVSPQPGPYPPPHPHRPHPRSQAPVDPQRRPPMPAPVPVPVPARDPSSGPVPFVDPAPPTRPIAALSKSLFEPQENTPHPRYRSGEGQVDTPQGHPPHAEETYAPVSESVNREYAQEIVRNRDDQGNRPPSSDSAPAPDSTPRASG
ncbi:hypothetical protein TVH25_08040 [Rhodococcus sp. 7Tela_A2]|uniref:hypothetical protein n=1 Tax=Rhodococcus sp. 7Tela_A2 TaxID=3093744 RepID=UPI003BB7221F